jgi:hypothetical protein
MPVILRESIPDEPVQKSHDVRAVMLLGPSANLPEM